MLRFRLLILIVTFAFLGVACSSQNIIENKDPAHSIEELQTQLEDVLKDMHVPGMSVAIVHRDGPEWIAGLGKADLATDRNATAATLFRIGSVSKGFVSLSILKLADEGKLSLEDSVKKLAPEVWFGNQWEASDPLRIVHLLENTTGWDDMHLRELAKDPINMSTIETLDYDHSSRISRWRPGTRMSYCNSGPAVAAYIVEKITGKSVEEYVGQNFFKPIGMQTATYFQPASELATTLYQSDGITPLPYWKLLYRSIGSINASANDMANYLLFYLNRGNMHGTHVIPSSIFNRMEVPFSTWAAKDGLQVGYGLHNYCTIHDGFVYHGHDGTVPGGLTAMEYLPYEGIGYFYSINSGKYEAFKKVGEIIRAYITSQLQKPAIPPVISLPENASAYTGWYEPSSPRMELFSFLERLIGMSYIHFEDNKLLVSSLIENNATFLPVNDTQFRYVPKSDSQDPISTLKLLTPNAEGQFIQISLGLRNPSIHSTIKRIPTWVAMFEIITAGFVFLTLMSTLIYAPFWMLRGLSQRHRRPAERGMRLWPLVAVLSLLSIVVICMQLDKDVAITLLGNLTIWSFSLFLATIVFSIASFASVIALWRAPRQEVRSIVQIYSTTVTFALVITTAYFAYWGIIGLRTWA
ncbi:MAG: beta-lactamase family protein [Parachlamydiaceae bacterium]|nr:beta-lactamase family protein [Parachlamydiaceae bacterium]